MNEEHITQAKLHMFVEDDGTVNYEWIKLHARFGVFFGKNIDKSGWIYVDKSGVMESGELPKEIVEAWNKFLNWNDACYQEVEK